MLRISRCCKQIQIISRRFCVSTVLSDEAKKPKKKVSETVELVHLIDQNDKFLGIKPKTESEKLARKLNLSLEKLESNKYGKTYPTYKMVAISDLLKAETKSVSQKTVKKLPINSKISDNDLKIKLLTVRKWIAKKYEVHIAIAGNSGTLKEVFEKIKENTKEDGRIINVRESDAAIKFIITPLKEDTINKTVANKKELQRDSKS